MSKPPPKVGTNSTPRLCSVGSKVPQTWVTTAALVENSTVEQPTEPITKPSEGMSQKNVYCLIAEMLAAIIQSGKLDTSTKKNVVKIIKLAREEEVKKDARLLSSGEQAKVSTIHEVIQEDLVGIHNSLEKQILQVQESCKVLLENTSKVLKDVEEVKTNTKDLACKVNKVTDATDKLASDTNSYRDALLSKPTPSNKANVDPRVLSNMDRKAKQILIDIYDKDADNILTKSLTAMIDKANEAISGIQDTSKPKNIKVVAALKTQGKVVLLTLNTEEAVSWIRELYNETTFKKAFSPKAHIRERAFNLIVLRIPVTFEPSEDKHLCEIEEANSLNISTISKARWIKPMERRRPNQTHAYAIITLTSADNANILIRDGLVICSMKVRPTKQKHKPMQYMKCRRWGHLVAECPSEKDTCSNCREEHCTSTCKNRNKTFCVACMEDMHASWSRSCPEFLRRCLIYDERNPENMMLYYPTMHDWSLMVCPSSLPLWERFLAKYTVNTLPIAGSRQQPPRPHQMYKGQNCRMTDRSGCENPNMIQIPCNHPREEGEPPGGVEPWLIEPNTRVDNTDETSPYNPLGWL